MKVFIVEFLEDYGDGPIEWNAFATRSLAEAYATARLDQLLSYENHYRPVPQISEMELQSDLSLITKYANQYKQKEIDEMQSQRDQEKSWHAMDFLTKPELLEEVLKLEDKTVLDFVKETNHGNSFPSRSE